jgi:hypothetical protein
MGCNHCCSGLPSLLLIWWMHGLLVGGLCASARQENPIHLIGAKKHCPSSRLGVAAKHARSQNPLYAWCAGTYALSTKITVPVSAVSTHALNPKTPGRSGRALGAADPKPPRLPLPNQSRSPKGGWRGYARAPAANEDLLSRGNRITWDISRIPGINGLARSLKKSGYGTYLETLVEA